MTSRRQFIGSGLAISTVSLALPETLRAERPGGDIFSAAPELVIYDERFDEAVAAARHAAALNIPAASTTHVLTELWFDELDLRWKKAPMTVAGLTTTRGLFVFETLALDRGMRVTARSPGQTAELIAWTIGPRTPIL